MKILNKKKERFIENLNMKSSSRKHCSAEGKNRKRTGKKSGTVYVKNKDPIETGSILSQIQRKTMY